MEHREEQEVGSLDDSTWSSSGRIVHRRALIGHFRICTRPLGNEHYKVGLLKCI